MLTEFNIHLLQPKENPKLDLYPVVTLLQLVMTYVTPGQMTWKLPGSDECALYLRYRASDPWRHYRDFPEYVLPDPPSFSDGYATFLALLKQKWQVFPN